MKSALSCAILVLLAACDAGTDPEKMPALAPKAAAPATAAAVGTAAELAAPTTPGGLGCAPDETPIFACNLANGKRVAVCGLGEHIGQYRYGGSRPELVLNGGDYAHVSYSGGGESQIAFSKSGYRYIVFWRVVRTNFSAGDHNDPATSEGVIILRGKEFAGMHLCSGDNLPTVSDASANAIWEDQQELFTGETIRADP